MFIYSFICHICLLNLSIYSDFYLKHSFASLFCLLSLVESLESHFHVDKRSNIAPVTITLNRNETNACKEQQSVETACGFSRLNAYRLRRRYLRQKSREKLIFCDGHRHIALLTNCFPYSLRCGLKKGEEKLKKRTWIGDDDEEA